MKKDIAIGLVIVIMAAVSLWTWFAGPCWLYKFEKAGEVPARCLMR